ncbi:SDR family oxidoreductase [Aggregatilinea lenta]|uniref:SDR family oxidoreductase n=1 Tax=Aggregatilinea lenta TaxID=913108 RepID=UPI000E5A44C3|nr:SDR family oxidoreductase [Aggregatilinea lenta]
MKLLVVGASSAIAHETARCFATDGAALFLVGRSAEKLAAIQHDLEVRGASQVVTYTLDLNDLAQHEAMIDAAFEALGGLDAALIAHGTLPDQAAVQASVEQALQEFQTNCLSAISLLTILGNRFEAQRRGCIAAISSVAGDRGRSSNYVYGAAKSALTVFLSGLRGRLEKSGVAVVTIKPGFVDTPMTAHVKKNPLFAKPDAVGKRIYTAMLKGQDVVYVPWFWRYVMLLIRVLPESMFKKLSF